MRSAVHHSVACGSPESEVLGGLVEVHIHFTPVRPIVVSESLTSPRNLCCVRTNFILLLFLFLCFKFFFFIFGSAGSLLLLRLFPSSVQRGLLSSCSARLQLEVAALLAEHGL